MTNRLPAVKFSSAWRAHATRWRNSALVGLSLLVAAMAPAQAATLNEMAGQMILVGFQGNNTSDRSVKEMRDVLASGAAGGVMYLKTNVSSLDNVRAINAMFTAAAPLARPFIALDQEGGSIERLTKAVGFAEIPSAESIGKTDTPAEAEAIYAAMARNLAAEGFNTNFGPVADVNVNPDNPIIARYGRSFSADEQEVAMFDEAFIDGHHEAGMLTALKHFPGHGSSTKDSHEGFVDISKTWQRRELVPYERLIPTGKVDMIMVGHLYHSDYAENPDDRTPASLSPTWINQVLRGRLGYAGVVISDDLEMSAIREHFSFRDTIVKAVLAGTDILLFSNTAQYHVGLADEVRQVLVNTAEADPAFRARVEQSYERIMALKRRIAP